ncbi:MAG: hypothetical protein WDZ84_09180 [Rhodovibrionaceae bacterium]
MHLAVGAGLCGALALGGCTYQGDLSTPGAQKLTWFSYLNGDDLRAGCSAEGPDRYRLVNNAVYEEQLRSYELRLESDSGGYYTARAQGVATLTRVTLDDPLAPWRWQTSETALTPAQGAAFTASLRESGFYAAPPVGKRFYSGFFYWWLVACEDGEMRYNAWEYGMPGYDTLKFPAWLYALDETGLAVNPPREIDLDKRLRDKNSGGRAGDDDPSLNFEIEMGRDGMVGRGPLF